MRNRFDEQLRQLKVDLIRMSSLCETAITVTMQNMLSSDQVYTLDDSEVAFRQLQHIQNAYEKAGYLKEEIDQMERQVENQCMKLLLHQQPVARDLRTISAALKMIYDLQRIGDQVDDIADIARYVQDTDLMHQLPMQQLADAAVSMVTDSVDAFVRMDFALAQHVIAADDTVDDYFSRMKEELAQVMRQDGNSSVCLDILMISKYLERIADHAVNIADWVIFAQTGAHSGKE